MKRQFALGSFAGLLAACASHSDTNCDTDAPELPVDTDAVEAGYAFAGWRPAVQFAYDIQNAEAVGVFYVDEFLPAQMVIVVGSQAYFDGDEDHEHELCEIRVSARGAVPEASWRGSVGANAAFQFDAESSDLAATCYSEDFDRRHLNELIREFTDGRSMGWSVGGTWGDVGPNWDLSSGQAPSGFYFAPIGAFSTSGFMNIGYAVALAVDDNFAVDFSDPEALFIEEDDLFPAGRPARAWWLLGTNEVVDL
jgi:hypothetical protein